MIYSVPQQTTNVLYIFKIAALVNKLESRHLLSFFACKKVFHIFLSIKKEMLFCCHNS